MVCLEPRTPRGRSVIHQGRDFLCIHRSCPHRKEPPPKNRVAPSLRPCAPHGAPAGSGLLRGSRSGAVRRTRRMFEHASGPRQSGLPTPQPHVPEPTRPSLHPAPCTLHPAPCTPSPSPSPKSSRRAHPPYGETGRAHTSNHFSLQSIATARTSAVHSWPSTFHSLRPHPEAALACRSYPRPRRATNRQVTLGQSHPG